MKILKSSEILFRQMKSSKTGELLSLSGDVTRLLGPEDVEIYLDRIPPQTRASSPHRHLLLEEIVYVLKGPVTVCEESERFIAEAGDFIFFDPSQTRLHYIANESLHEVAETLTFSKNRKTDVVVYENTQLWMPPNLKTPRLTLRPLRLSDAEHVFAYAKNPNVSRYTVWEPHKSINDSIDYILNYAFWYYAQEIPEPWAITLSEDPETVIGTVGCFWVSKQARSMELAYALSENFWGQGLIAEASSKVMEYCFSQYSIKRIQARCKSPNKASARVMEKVGMSFEGTLKSSLYHRDEFWDMHYYAAVK